MIHPQLPVPFRLSRENHAFCRMSPKTFPVLIVSLLLVATVHSDPRHRSMNALLRMGKRQIFLMSSSAVHGYEYLQHAESDLRAYFGK